MKQGLSVTDTTAYQSTLTIRLDNGTVVRNAEAIGRPAAAR
jgi:hypothetical protein